MQPLETIVYTSRFWVIFENARNCRLKIAAPCRNIFHAAKSFRMPYTANVGKTECFSNRIKNPFELRLVKCRTTERRPQTTKLGSSITDCGPRTSDRRLQTADLGPRTSRRSRQGDGGSLSASFCNLLRVFLDVCLPGKMI
jgi:hypothetical protein